MKTRADTARLCRKSVAQILLNPAASAGESADWFEIAAEKPPLIRGTQFEVRGC
jgi:hypothetical protein